MILYTLPNCPACTKAKAALDAVGVHYETHTFPSTYEMRVAMRHAGLSETVPKLEIEGSWLMDSTEIINAASGLRGI